MTEQKTTDEKLDQLLEISRLNGNNIKALYRRMTALAFMLEAVSQGREVSMPQVMRAEIDASIDKEAFETLAREDKAEFIRHYGQMVLDIVNQMGAEAITTIGEFAPKKSHEKRH